MEGMQSSLVDSRLLQNPWKRDVQDVVLEYTSIVHKTIGPPTNTIGT